MRAKNVVKFYNGRGPAESWIKEGKNAVKWTKLSCRTFQDNQTRLSATGGFALAYNLANFLRRLVLPRTVKHWSLTTLREKLVKIGAKVTRGRLKKRWWRVCGHDVRGSLPPHTSDRRSRELGEPETVVGDLRSDVFGEVRRPAPSGPSLSGATFHVEHAIACWIPLPVDRS